MYEEFYKFSGKPFQLNPDPNFFFQSQGHQRAMAYLRYGLQQGQGFIVVTGDVGTGKTMLVNNLFKELQAKNVVAAKIVSTNISENDLLRVVSSQFELPYERMSKASLLNQLEVFFRACVDEGKRVLLLVDEAQNLPRGSLEELRMLSNLDYNDQPVVQSFLLGQREFRTVMRSPGLEQLRQRVLAAYHLKPLSADETKTYIRHRLTKVGWTSDPVIDDDIYWSVFQFTTGVPRRINTLFDRLLLSASLEEAHRLTGPMLQAVIAEIVVEQESGGPADEGVEPAAEPARPGRAAAAALPGSVASTAEHATADDATIAIVRKLEARLAALQRAFDNLSGELARPQLENQAENPAARGRKIQVPLWSLAVTGAVLALGVLGAAALYLFK